MMDFEKARQTMVDCQIRPNDVTNHDIIAAFMHVPRESFVSTAQKPLAYIDEDLPVNASGSTRYLMETMSMSKLIQLAEIDEDCIVLDIGCATGYSTAVLSMLCNSVVAVESDAELAEQASQTLVELGYDNAVVVNAPMENGYAKEGPYDVIFVGGAVEVLPEHLASQLKEGGRLVVVEGTGNAGVARVLTKFDDHLGTRTAFNCSIQPLPGFNRAAEFVF